YRQSQFFLTIDVRRTVKENQLCFVRACERRCITHRFSGVGRQISRTKNAFDIDHDCPPFRKYFAGLTTSTEQCARAETAEETLPSSRRSMPLVPLAPTKMQSAPHVLASSSISSAGLPRLIKTSACNPALRIRCAAGSKISRTWFQLLSSATSSHFMADGSEGFAV